MKLLCESCKTPTGLAEMYVLKIPWMLYEEHIELRFCSQECMSKYLEANQIFNRIELNRRGKTQFVYDTSREGYFEEATK